SKVTSARFNSLGDVVATCSEDGMVKFWSTKTGTLLSSIKAHSKAINSISFNSKSDCFLTVSKDGTAKLWNAKTRKLIRSFATEEKGEIISAEFAKNSDLIYAASSEFVYLWETTNGKLKAKIEHDSEVWSAKFIGNKYLLSYSLGNVKRWDIVKGRFANDANLVIQLNDDAGITITSLDTALNESMSEMIPISEMQEYGINFAKISENGTQLITGFTDGNVKVYDITNNTELSAYSLKRDIASNKFAEFSSDQQQVIIASANASAQIWDMRTVERKLNLNAHQEELTFAHFSKDGKKALTVMFKNLLNIWDAITGKLINTIDIGTENFFTSANFSADSKKILTVNDGSVSLFETETAELIRTINTPNAVAAIFSPDEREVLTAFDNGGAAIYDVETGLERLRIESIVNKDEGNRFNIFSTSLPSYSRDGKKMILSSKNGKNATVYDTRNGKVVYELIGHESWITSVSYSPNGAYIATASEDKTIKVWDASSHKLLASLKGHDGHVNSARFSGDSKMIISSSSDNSSKIWDVEKGKLLCTLIAIDSLDYIAITPDGYYKASKNASKKIHYVTKDQRFINFDQLDVKFNRPDKVLKALRSTDDVLIKSYYKAYEKRINKLKIDTSIYASNLSIPSATIFEPEKIKYIQASKTLKIRVKGEDKAQPLVALYVWVNENPVFGLNGISLKKLGRITIDTTLSIDLSDGDNNIEISVVNKVGIESFRKPIKVRYISKEPSVPHLYFIGIGIDKFAQKENNLNWCVKDIRDLVNAFKSKNQSNLTIDTLFNENVSVESIKALKTRLLDININDKVVVAYSGHGLIGKNLDYYLSTYTVDFKDPQSNGLSYEEIENLVTNIPARQKLLLLDACHSGEFDKEEQMRLSEIQKKLEESKIEATKGVILKNTAAIGIRNSFELMQQLFTNVSRSTGATVISAASGTQFAIESNDLKGGVFTYSILEFLKKNRHPKVAELKGYVGKRVLTLTEGRQVPTIRNDTPLTDWQLW
ncbi:MAG: hypothetical protein EOO47_17555, partial [Flavobacterium sp.]